MTPGQSSKPATTLAGLLVWLACVGVLTGLVATGALVPARPATRASPVTYPVAPAGAVADDYHGTVVADPWRQLEDLSSPETLHWVAAQNDLTEGHISRLPGRARTISGCRRGCAGGRHRRRLRRLGPDRHDHGKVGRGGRHRRLSCRLECQPGG